MSRLAFTFVDVGGLRKLMTPLGQSADYRRGENGVRQVGRFANTCLHPQSRQGCSGGEDSASHGPECLSLANDLHFRLLHSPSRDWRAFTPVRVKEPNGSLRSPGRKGGPMADLR